MKPLIVFMAGSAASGKSEMAYRLSETFGLPIFSTDSIRIDTKVEKDVVDINEVVEAFNAERDRRAKAIISKSQSFVYDGSADRRWADMKRQVEEAGYDWLLVSFDLSPELINKHRKMFDRVENDAMYEKWSADHQKFLDDFSNDVQLHITDDNYADRYKLASELVQKKLK